jgi:hypothetical protein
MTDPDRDGASRPRPAHRPEDETPQQPRDPGQQYQGYPAQPSASQQYPPQQPGAAVYHPSVIAQQQAAQQQAAQQQAAQQQYGALPPPPSTLAARPATQAAPPPVVARASVPVQARPADSPSVADPSARRLAAPAVTAAPLAAPGALFAAGALAADKPENGGPPPSEGNAQADAEARTGPSGKMSRLHVGWHSISRATLKKVAVAPSAGAGLILGRDRQHTAVPLRLFSPEPVRVTLVGGVWAAQLLIFRAFSLGARVTVVTTEPQAWAGFGERATGQYNRLTVLSGDQGPAVTGTAQIPMLSVYDLGMTGPVTAPPLGPWRTQLTVLRQLDRPGVPALQDAQLTLLQRLGGDEAALASSALRLRSHSSQFLQFMADDMMALIDEGTDRYLFLAQTGVEQQQVGMPRR